MFWGLILESGKRYSTTVDKSFHVSMASLDCSSVKSDSEIISIVLECEGQENILCNLSKQHKLLQCPLDLNFITGDKVTFEARGRGSVHLSGYLCLDEDDDNDDDDDNIDDEEFENMQNLLDSDRVDLADFLKGKRKSVVELNTSKKKKPKINKENDSDNDGSDNDDQEDNELEEDSSDENEIEEGDSDDSDDDDDDDNDDDDEEDESEEDNEEPEETPSPPQKQKGTPPSNKKQTQPPNNRVTPINNKQSTNKNITPLLNGSAKKEQLSSKKNQKKGQDTPKTPALNESKNKNQKTPTSVAGTPQKKKLEGGILIKEIKEGNGPIAKNGQMVSVYYQGRLKSNNKVFDECKRGGPTFKFRLGKGEVIKGWDIGLNGMKVGGIRSITCPPNMAYGPKGSPPTIPPNSALLFQVELKAIN